MDNQSDLKKQFSGFSKLSRDQRFQRLLEMGVLKLSDIEYLRKGGVQDLDLAENFIENSVGYFQLPLGVATNFVINEKAYVIPMAVEETSIIAAASKTARWVDQNGALRTRVEGTDIIGQIQLAQVKNFSKLESLLKEKKQIEDLIGESKQLLGLLEDLDAALELASEGEAEYVQETADTAINKRCLL